MFVNFKSYFLNKTDVAVVTTWSTGKDAGPHFPSFHRLHSWKGGLYNENEHETEIEKSERWYLTTCWLILCMSVRYSKCLESQHDLNPISEMFTRKK